MNSELLWLQAGEDFPPPENALSEPNGLLAAGGDLSSETLISAYRQGIFPWYSDGQPPLWWSPDPRAVLRPGDIHISRSLAKEIRRKKYQLSSDQDFPAVIRACTSNRRDGTWILQEIIEAYERLFARGHAHSVEVLFEGELIGGLYGVAVGDIFCGESMFSRRPNASKIAFTSLALRLFQAGFQLIDCQIENPHLSSLGAKLLSRNGYLKLLQTGRDKRVDWPDMSFCPAELVRKHTS